MYRMRPSPPKDKAKRPANQHLQVKRVLRVVNALGRAGVRWPLSLAGTSILKMNPSIFVANTFEGATQGRKIHAHAVTQHAAPVQAGLHGKKAFVENNARWYFPATVAMATHWQAIATVAYHASYLAGASWEINPQAAIEPWILFVKTDRCISMTWMI